MDPVSNAAEVGGAGERAGVDQSGAETTALEAIDHKTAGLAKGEGGASSQQESKTQQAGASHQTAHSSPPAVAVVQEAAPLPGGHPTGQAEASAGCGKAGESEPSAGGERDSSLPGQISGPGLGDDVVRDESVELNEGPVDVEDERVGQDEQDQAGEGGVVVESAKSRGKGKAKEEASGQSNGELSPSTRPTSRPVGYSSRRDEKDDDDNDDDDWDRSADRPRLKRPIRFKDVLGRQMLWPWERAKTWKVSVSWSRRVQSFACSQHAGRRVHRHCSGSWCGARQYSRPVLAT